jgi:hypothetical protein
MDPKESVRAVTEGFYLEYVSEFEIAVAPSRAASAQHP